MRLAICDGWMSSASSRSSASVNTATTPGALRAAVVSTPSKRAWAWWLRTNAAWSIPGARTSST